MVDVATAFAYCQLPRGNRVAIITGSGGSAVWMADILSAHGLELPVLEEDIQRRLMAMLPSYASAQNPIDATAQAIGEVGYAPMVELVRQSERIDTILLISSLANESRAKKMADELAPITATLDKPILMSTYTTATPAAIATLGRRRHPLLHLDAELRPRDPRAGRLRRVPRAAGPPRRRARYRRRCVRDEVARALPLPGPVLTEARLEGAAGALRRAAAAGGAGHERGRGGRGGGQDRRHGRAEGAVARHPAQDRGRRGRARPRAARTRCATATARCWRAPRRRTRTPRIEGVLVQAMARRGHRDDPRRHARPRFRPDADGRARRHPCRGVARRRLRAGAARPRRRGAGCSAS